MIDHNETRSRRALLTAAVAGAGAALATVMGRPSAVRGADGDDMKLGRRNVATSVTSVRNAEGIALRGTSRTEIGVYGVSHDGPGVFGFSRESAGVEGFTEYGIGLRASTEFGIGVLAIGYAGTALDVRGQATFSWSGVATIPAGETSVVFDVGVGEDPNVYPSSFILLSPKTDLGGRDLWYKTNPGAGRFSIHISTPRTSATEVAWLLLK